jgi:hypothetical protein
MTLNLTFLDFLFSCFSFEYHLGWMKWLLGDPFGRFAKLSGLSGFSGLPSFAA